MVVHLSWETEDIIADFLASRFPKAVPMGDAGSTSVEKIPEMLERLLIPKNTLVIISGGPPCVDHSRIKNKRAPEGRGKEGKKLVDLRSWRGT